MGLSYRLGLRGGSWPGAGARHSQHGRGGAGDQGDRMGALSRHQGDHKTMKLFSRSSAQGPGRRRGLAGRLALSVGLLLPLASFSAFAAALGGASPASASVPGSELPNGGMYTPVTPNRIADTRPNSGFQGAGDTLTSGQILTFRVAGLPGDMVPSFATAVVLNITAVTPSAAGYLTAIAAGQTFPLV